MFFSTVAHAGLSRPPSSHVEFTADGLHVLIFLAPIQSAADQSVTQEERDRTLKLNSMYPASGCYWIGSTTPLWTAPWDDRDHWIVSDDNRYLIRLNIFGDGDFNSRTVGKRELSWGLKFYDRGEEIKSYDVAELLDFPSLMAFTSWDWHYQWFGDATPTIQDGQFVFQTSTHDYYRFDPATGAIVHEFRMWRKLIRAGTVLFAMTLVGVTFFIVRRRKKVTVAQQTADGLLELSHYYPPQLSTRRYRYSLKTLLLVTTAIAITCLTLPRWPRVSLFVTALFVAITLTRAASRYTRRTSVSQLSGRRRGLIIRVAVACLAWVGCYILSVAPVTSLLRWLDAPQDVRMAVQLTVYRPFTWLSQFDSLRQILNQLV